WKNQARGGRKGGLPLCELVTPLTSGGTSFAASGKVTGNDIASGMKLKQFSAQAANDVQSLIALLSAAFGSQSCVCEQQSVIACSADAAAALGVNVAPTAIGTRPTDIAITKANVIRKAFMHGPNIAGPNEGQVTISRSYRTVRRQKRRGASDCPRRAKPLKVQ